MIYLDVTSSCKSPMNTGVQRVVRGLYRCLLEMTPVTPLVWDPGLRTYCSLSAREHGFLVSPFAKKNGAAAREGGDAEPGRRANPIPVLSKWVRAVTHRLNRKDFPACLGCGDTLFVPEIFQDNRVTLLPTWARKSDARFVTVCHDAIAFRRPDITNPARQAGFLAYLEALGSFEGVVAVSHETREELLAIWQERSCPSAPVTVEPWPVNHAGRERPLSAIDPKARSILCVGTFEPRKNHLLLLDAAKRAWENGMDFELVLIGRTTAQWGDRVLEAIGSLQSAGHAVRWLRHVDDETLGRAYQECAFTVFPSLVEGFGLPILESLWYGRPCLCGSNGAIGEVAKGGGCLTVDQTDAAVLASGIESLLKDTGLRNRLAQEARIRLFDSWEGLASRLLPLLRQPSSAI